MASSSGSGLVEGGRRAASELQMACAQRGGEPVVGGVVRRLLLVGLAGAPEGEPALYDLVPQVPAADWDAVRMFRGSDRRQNFTAPAGYPDRHSRVRWPSFFELDGLSECRPGCLTDGAGPWHPAIVFAASRRAHFASVSATWAGQPSAVMSVSRRPLPGLTTLSITGSPTGFWAPGQ